MFEANSTNTTVDIIEVITPTIMIDKKALTKMKLYIDKCSDEIGWLGVANEYNEEVIVIEDVLLFDQEVHSTTTEITPEGLSEFGEELLQKENGVELWNSLKVWGHSHVNMSVSPSSQDDKQMLVFKDSGHEWFIRIIANKSGKLKLDLYDYKSGIAYKDAPWHILDSKEEREIKLKIAELKKELEAIDDERIKKYEDEVDKDMKKKVRKKSYYTVNKTNYYHDYLKQKQEKIKKKEEEAIVYDKDSHSYYGTSYETAKVIYDKFEIERIKMLNEEDGMLENFMIAEFLQCETIEEIRDVITLYGYDDVYTDDEIKNMMADIYYKQYDIEGEDEIDVGFS